MSEMKQGNLIEYQPTKKEKYQTYLENLRECQDCSLKSEGQHYCPGWGNLDADVMFIGEAPGEVSNPDLRGLAFVGNRSSDMFYKAIKETFGEYGDIWTTNVVKCNPPGNRTPSRLEILCCSKFIYKELHIVKPEIIVLLGRTAIDFLLPECRGKSIKNLLGKKFSWQGIPIYAMYHPAYACRCGPKFERVYLGWFRILKRKYDELVADGGKRTT